MKRVILTTVALFTMVLFTNPVAAQDHQHHENHEQMMQSMMEGREMDHSRMMEMMQDSPMMGMHMHCMQMMHGDDMEGGDSDSDDHNQHH